MCELFYPNPPGPGARDEIREDTTLKSTEYLGHHCHVHTEGLEQDRTRKDVEHCLALSIMLLGWLR